MNTNFTYTLRTSRRVRKLRLAIYATGECVITKPKYVTEGMVKVFIQKHLSWIAKKLEQIKLRPQLTYGDYQDYKAQAYNLAMARLNHFNAVYNFNVGKVSVRNQKTRWGSCSKKGNLNFNYKIALIAPELVDYVIVHELCHLQEFNHGKKFWELVAKTIPDWRERRKELKKL